MKIARGRFLYRERCRRGFFYLPCHGFLLSVLNWIAINTLFLVLINNFYFIALKVLKASASKALLLSITNGSQGFKLSTSTNYYRTLRKYLPP